MKRACVCLLVGLVAFGCVTPSLGSEVERTVSISPQGFHEVNLEMEAGDSFRYIWDLAETDATVFFDVHTHRNGTVQDHVQGQFHDADGTYVQAMAGGVSLMWRNQNAGSVLLHYRVEGDFQVQP